MYRLHLWDRLPREMIASCMWSECARLARDWVDAHRAEIDEVVARFERGEIAGDVMLDELCERARAWAHAASGIDFLENDPCPY